jgi:hypothetical protein
VGIGCEWTWIRIVVDISDVESSGSVTEVRVR